MKISPEQKIVTNRGNKYRFVKRTGHRNCCIDCAFKRNSMDFCMGAPCTPTERDDAKKGYFVKVKKKNKEES